MEAVARRGAEVNLVAACVICGGPGFRQGVNCLPTWFISNEANEKSPCEAYRELLEMASGGVDAIVYAHDDLELHDPNWIERLRKLFDNPLCVAAGFGGAWGLGNADLYRKPYKIENLARRGYASNQRDAETHGERFAGDKRVAVLDAFCLAVRVDWLRTRRTLIPWHPGVDRDGVMEFELGWPTKRLTHHCLDLWLACEAARDEKEIWMAGVDCTHHGGGSSTKKGYAGAKWLQCGSLGEDHSRPHMWLYQEYSDVLPIEVKG